MSVLACERGQTNLHSKNPVLPHFPRLYVCAAVALYRPQYTTVFAFHPCAQKRAPRENPDLVKYPTFGHMACVALLEKGFIKHVVSQNVDGLHVRSGIPFENVCFHGIVWLIVCVIVCL